MSEWLDILSDWTGIKVNILIPVLVFGVVIAMIIAGGITVALGTIVRATRRDKARQSRAERST